MEIIFITALGVLALALIGEGLIKIYDNKDKKNL